jgi:hypothetical protein
MHRKEQLVACRCSCYDVLGTSKWVLIILFAVLMSAHHRGMRPPRQFFMTTRHQAQENKPWAGMK